MFMRAEAAVFMVVIVVMLIGSMGDGQRQQGKRQSEQQTTHSGLREVK
jgi:preprotein translocase subunit YajC